MTSEELFDEIWDHGAQIGGNKTAHTGNRDETATHKIVEVTLGDGRAFTGSNENGSWEFSELSGPK